MVRRVQGEVPEVSETIPYLAVASYKTVAAMNVSIFVFDSRERTAHLLARCDRRRLADSVIGRACLGEKGADQAEMQSKLS